MSPLLLLLEHFEVAAEGKEEDLINPLATPSRNVGYFNWDNLRKLEMGKNYCI